MNTYVHVKTGNRYPDSGVASRFSEFSNGWQVFIKPGYPEFTNGWKKMKMTEWVGEVIPDLPKPFTKQQWLDYAKQYGVTCAQEFLDCCDYSKPFEAQRMFLPPPANKQRWLDAQAWFAATFHRPLEEFIDALMYMYGNTYSLDILRFEKHLASEFNYPMHKDGSMRDFMIATFGEETTNKFVQLFLSPA